MDYILYSDNTFKHFFHSPLRGLCFKEKVNGRWTESQTIFQKAKDGFSVFLDAENIHILCADKEGAIFYITRKNSDWKTFKILNENPEISPLEFKIAKAGNIINFFYSAKYNHSIILVHCVLGQNAKPEIIDELSPDSESFSICSDKVYYTNKGNVLGFRNFSDSKPDIFTKIADNATDCYAATFSNSEYILYKKDGFILLNENPIFSDPSCKKPIISQTDNRLMIQWKYNTFIRYLTSFNNGATWSAPMRFIGNGENISEFCILGCGNNYICYGQNLKPDPVLYGKSNLFFTQNPKKS